VRFDLAEQNGVTTVCVTHSSFATQGSHNAHHGWPQIPGWPKAFAEA